MRVGTFNLRYDTPADAKIAPWSERVHEVVAAFHNMNCDVVGTQEGLLHQLNDLTSLLNNAYEWSGKARDGNGHGEHCAVFYRKDRFVLAESGTFWLSETPDVEASRSWNSACNRVASWVVLAQKGAEHIKSLVTSCHLDHFSEVARVNSCRLIVQKANDLSQWFGCRTSFIVGDFNTSPGDEPQCYAPFLESSFRDACVEALERFEEKGTFHNFTGSSIGSRIDWLYVGGYAKSKRAIIYTQKKGKFYPSDHFPLYCEFSL